MFRSVPMFITVSGNFLCVVQKCGVFQCRIKAISMKSHWTVYMFVTLFMLLQSFTNIWISLHSVFGKRCNFPPINMHLLFTVDHEFYFDDTKYVYPDWSVNDILSDLPFSKFITIKCYRILVSKTYQSRIKSGRLKAVQTKLYYVKGHYGIIFN